MLHQHEECVCLEIIFTTRPTHHCLELTQAMLLTLYYRSFQQLGSIGQFPQGMIISVLNNANDPINHHAKVQILLYTNPIKVGDLTMCLHHGGLKIYMLTSLKSAVDKKNSQT